MTETEKRVPDLRFKGFIEDWEQRKLGEVGELNRGKSKHRPRNDAKLFGGSYPFIQTGDVAKAGLYLTNYGQTYSDFGIQQSKLWNEGTLLITIAANIAETSILGIKAAFPDSVIAFESDDVDMVFVKNVIDKISDMLKRTAETSSQANLNLAKLSELKIDLPSIGEQIKIGAFFKQLDDTIALHQRKLTLLEQLKQSYLQLMCPQNKGNIPALRFAGFSEPWEQRKIRELFTVTRGQVLAATKTKDKETNNFIYPVYSSQTKNNGLMGFYDQYLFENAITWTTDGANAGTVNFRKGKFYSTNVNGVLLSDKGFANKAISEIINKIAWKHVSKVGNPKLMNNVMSEITVTIPFVEEQNKLSLLFEQLDDTIDLHKCMLDKLLELRLVFLRKMFL